MQHSPRLAQTAQQGRASKKIRGWRVSAGGWQENTRTGHSFGGVVRLVLVLCDGRRRPRYVVFHRQAHQCPRSRQYLAPCICRSLPHCILAPPLTAPQAPPSSVSGLGAGAAWATMTTGPLVQAPQYVCMLQLPLFAANSLHSFASPFGRLQCLFFCKSSISSTVKT